MKTLTYLLSLTFVLLFLGCQNGQYVGPSVGANVGYNGISVGVALYGPNPSAANINVVKNTSPTPAPTPSPIVVSAK